MFSAAYVAESKWNDTFWRTTDSAIKFNQLVKDARKELDESKKREILFESKHADFDKNPAKYEPLDWYTGAIMLVGELVD